MLISQMYEHLCIFMREYTAPFLTYLKWGISLPNENQLNKLYFFSPWCLQSVGVVTKHY